MNLIDFILQRARLQPNAVAIVDGEQILRYADLDRAIRLAAGALAERGVREGSVVAMEMPNVALHLIVAFAVARLRAISTPVPDGRNVTERIALLKRFGAKFLVSEKRIDVPEGFEPIVADAELVRGRRLRDEPGHGPEAGALPWRIQWSSGTTGTPKPIVFTHGASIAHAFAEQAGIPYSTASVLYPAIGIKLSFALVHCVRMLIMGGTIVGHAPRGSETFALCRRHGVTHMISSPAIAAKLVSTVGEDAPQLPDTALYLGGGLVAPALRERLARRFTPRIGIIYGSTEAGEVAVAHPQDYAARPDTVGRPVPWLQLEIVDDDDRPLPADATGRVRMRGIGCVRSYNGETEGAFKDGWFYPGDLGRLTPEGLLAIEGRAVEVLNVGGTKVAPDIVENALGEHPSVAEAAAFMASDRGGRQWLLAAVVAREGFDQETVTRFARQKLGKLAPALIVPVERIPRTDMGKIKRMELSERFVIDRKPPQREGAEAGGPGGATTVEAASSNGGAPAGS